MTNEFDNGVSQLQAVLDIFNNKTEYAKQLREIDNKNKELRSLVRAVGTITEIDKIKRAAQVELEKLQSENDFLKEKSAVIDVTIAEAESRASTIINNASVRIREQQYALDQREKELAENRKQFNIREIELRRNEEKVRVIKLAVESDLRRAKQAQESTNRFAVEYGVRV